MNAKYTSIRVKRETKELLEKLLVKMEYELGRRLDYDELLKIIATRILSGHKRPEFLAKLAENPIADHDTALAMRILREERRRDDRF